MIARCVEMRAETLTESDSLDDASYQFGFGLVTLERFEGAEASTERSGDWDPTFRNVSTRSRWRR